MAAIGQRPPTFPTPSLPPARASLQKHLDAASHHRCRAPTACAPGYEAIGGLGNGASCTTCICACTEPFSGMLRGAARAHAKAKPPQQKTMVRIGTAMSSTTAVMMMPAMAPAVSEKPTELTGSESDAADLEGVVDIVDDGEGEGVGVGESVDVFEEDKEMEVVGEADDESVDDGDGDEEHEGAIMSILSTTLSENPQSAEPVSQGVVKMVPVDDTATLKGLRLPAINVSNPFCVTFSTPYRVAAKSVPSGASARPVEYILPPGIRPLKPTSVVT